MIEDDELRLLFKAASEEHLQNLDDGLLHLEQHPDDSAALEALLREAHSLKGDANMLGVREVGTLAHQIEHVLTQVQQATMTWSIELGDCLAHALLAVRQLVNEAVTGEPAEIDTFQVLAQLMGTPAPAASQSVPVVDLLNQGTDENLEDISLAMTDDLAQEPPLEPPLSQPEPALMVLKSPVAIDPVETVIIDSMQTVNAQVAHLPIAAHSVPAKKLGSGEAYRIETIRVATHNLDSLMTQAGELTVTKIRIAHRVSEVTAIAELWEDWNRDLFTNRFIVNDLRQNQAALHRLETFYNRAEQRLEQLGILIKKLHSSLHEDTARLGLISDDLEEGIRTLRMLPLATIFNLFPRMVRDLSRQEGKEIELIIEGKDTCADKRILEEMKDPLMHIIRNAIDHGIETPQQRSASGKSPIAKIWVRGYQTSTNIVLEVADDGKGLDLEKIGQTAIKRGICRDDELAAMTPTQIQSLIFMPGFSTAPLVTEVSGRGVGLDVVRTNVEKLKGNIEVKSTKGKGCTIRIQLGLTLATAHVLIVAVNSNPYALPVESVWLTCSVDADEIFTLEGRETIVRSGQPVSIVHLADLLELPDGRQASSTRTKSSHLSCIILQVGQEKLGVLVDALVDEQDVVLKPQSQLLKRVRNVAGTTILGTGEVCIVLNPQDLVKSVHRRSVSTIRTQSVQAAPVKQTVLLVEDSIAIRTQEKRILESAGYSVVTAVDGLDGFTKLKSRSFDAIVSDVQMPNLDGLELAARVRQHREYNEIPIILVTSLASDEDKRRGAEAGANAYIPKGSFNQDVLLETLQRLI